MIVQGWVLESCGRYFDGAGWGPLASAVTYAMPFEAQQAVKDRAPGGRPVAVDIDKEGRVSLAKMADA